MLAVRTDLLYCIDNNFGELDADELFTLFTYFQQYDFEIDASLSTFISRYVHAFDWRFFPEADGSVDEYAGRCREDPHPFA